MPLEFYIAIGSIISMIGLGLFLAQYNIKLLRANKQYRIEQRRKERAARKKRLL